MKIKYTSIIDIIDCNFKFIKYILDAILSIKCWTFYLRYFSFQDYYYFLISYSSSFFLILLINFSHLFEPLFMPFAFISFFFCAFSSLFFSSCSYPLLSCNTFPTVSCFSDTSFFSHQFLYFVFSFLVFAFFLSFRNRFPCYCLLRCLFIVVVFFPSFLSSASFSFNNPHLDSCSYLCIQ